MLVIRAEINALLQSSHFYWVPGAVRAIVPGVVKDDQLIQPIEPGLQQYPPNSVEFILGTATDLETSTKTVTISTESGERQVQYEYLVLATGARQADPSMPWKATGTHDELLTSLHGTADKVKTAKHIVVAGGGSTGVEVAAEIRYEFKDKEVVLVSAGETLVGGDLIAGSVESELGKLGVVVRKGVKVEETKPLPDDRTQVTLSNGEVLTTDFYMPTTGLKPNSEWLPKDLLTSAGYAQVDEFFSVTGVENVWAAGDVVSRPKASFLYTEAQAGSVAKNIQLTIAGQPQKPVGGPLVDGFICSMGRSRAAGRVRGIQIPSIAGWIGKGRTLGMERTKKYVDGSMW